MQQFLERNDAYEIELADGIAYLRLREHASKLLIDLRVRDQFIDHIKSIDESSSAIGLILMNEGQNIGGTVREELLTKIMKGSPQSELIGKLLRNSLSVIALVVIEFGKPLVAGLAGDLSTEELSLPMLCDRRIAAENLRISNHGLHQGFPPGAVLTFELPRIVGSARALELLTTEEPIEAVQLEALGLVSKVVPTARLQAECQAQMHRLSQLPKLVMSNTRRLIHDDFSNFKEHVDRSISLMLESIWTRNLR